MDYKIKRWPIPGGVVGFLFGAGAGFIITGLGVGLTPEIIETRLVMTS